MVNGVVIGILDMKYQGNKLEQFIDHNQEYSKREEEKHLANCFKFTILQYNCKIRMFVFRSKIKILVQKKICIQILFSCGSHCKKKVNGFPVIPGQGEFGK